MTTSCLIRIIPLVLVLASSPASAQTASDVRESALAVFEAGAQAWNRGDLDGYLATYAEDARWVSGTTVIRGRAQIAAAFRSRFHAADEMGSLAAENLEVDVIGASDAVVFGEWVHTLGERVRRGVFTVHLRRFGDEWLTVSDHTSGGE